MARHMVPGIARPSLLVLGLIAAAILTGLAFAAWQANGPALMNALSASGLAWCL